MIRHLTALALLVTLGTAQESRPGVFDAGKLRPVFDGKTLDGWVTKGGHYDGNADWRVEDGAISGREGPDHGGGLIYTAQRYACFLLSLSVWMTRPNDSGIFVRMAPQGRGAQVTLDDRDDGEIGAVYSDEFLAHNGTARAKWKPGTWNRVEVRVTGRDMRVEAWVNGEKIADHQIPAGTPGFAPTGLIGLQVHGNRNDPPGTVVRFRDIRVRELPVFDNADFTVDEDGVMTPTGAARKRGWQDLSDKSAWAEAEDGPRTTRDFQDFELHVDYKLVEEGGNSGVFLRAAGTRDNPAFSGCEIQILDDDNWEKIHKQRLEPWQFTGSVYGSSPPKERGAPKPVGSWNSYRILYQGSRLLVELNGVLLQDVDVLSLPVPSSTRPFAERAKTGFIGLQQHGKDARPEFRNVFVRPIR